MSLGRAVFVRMGSRPIPRVARMMEVARSVGYDPLFCGAFRERELPVQDEWSGLMVHRVGPMFPLLNGRRPLLYGRSVFRFNRAVLDLLRSIRPALVHASDVETFPAAKIYSRETGARLIYNIHDNLAQRYQLPAPVRGVLNALEGRCVTLSDATLVPESFRRDSLPSWSRERVRVVRNTPQDPGKGEPPSLDVGEIRFFYGGWIDEGRGISILLDLMEQIPGMRLRVAGEGDDRLIRRIEAHERAEYLGFLTHSAVLEESRCSHFIPAMYNPERIINRFAASNKLAEAFAMGRPIIANVEMAVVQQYAAAPCIVAANYGDVEGLAAQVLELASSWDRYRDMCDAARRLYEKDYSWTVARETARTAILGMQGPAAP